MTDKPSPPPPPAWMVTTALYIEQGRDEDIGFEPRVLRTAALIQKHAPLPARSEREERLARFVHYLITDKLLPHWVVDSARKALEEKP